MSELLMSSLPEETINRYSGAKRESFYTVVVGTTFRPADDIASVDDGDFAFLTAELNNEHDKTAVAVVHQKTTNHIGYIKRELNKDIWDNIVNNGDLYVCRIERTGGTESKPNIGFNLNVIRMYFEDETKNVKR